MCRSSCLTLVTGGTASGPNESKREAFVAEYTALWEEAQRTEASFFAAEAHFRADAELRGKWVLKGKPALVDSHTVWGEGQLLFSGVPGDGRGGMDGTGGQQLPEPRLQRNWSRDNAPAPFRQAQEWGKR